MDNWRYNFVICAVAIAIALFGATSASAVDSIECSDEVSCAQACTNMENQLNSEDDGKTWSCALADTNTEEIVETPGGGGTTVHTTYWCNCVHWTNAESNGDGDGFTPGDDATLFPGKKPGFDIVRPRPPKTDYQDCLDKAYDDYDKAYRDCFPLGVAYNAAGELIPTHGKERPVKGYAPGYQEELEDCKKKENAKLNEAKDECLRKERWRQSTIKRKLPGFPLNELKKKNK